MTFLLQISDRSTKCRQLTFAVSILLFKVPCRDSLVIIHMHFILFLFKNVDLVLYFQRRLNKGLIMIRSLICILIHWVFIGKLLDVRLCCSKQLRWKRHGPSPGRSYSPDKRETKQFNGRSPRPCFWQEGPCGLGWRNALVETCTPVSISMSGHTSGSLLHHAWLSWQKNWPVFAVSILRLFLEKVFRTHSWDQMKYYLPWR